MVLEVKQLKASLVLHARTHTHTLTEHSQEVKRTAEFDKTYNICVIVCIFDSAGGFGGKSIHFEHARAMRIKFCSPLPG